VPYRSSFEVWSRQGVTQIHVYLTFCFGFAVYSGWWSKSLNCDLSHFYKQSTTRSKCSIWNFVSWLKYNICNKKTMRWFVIPVNVKLCLFWLLLVHFQQVVVFIVPVWLNAVCLCHCMCVGDADTVLLLWMPCSFFFLCITLSTEILLASPWIMETSVIDLQL